MNRHYQRLFFIMLILSITLLLTGCANGFFPPMNALNGQLVQDRYTQKIGSQPNLGRFSIQIPHQPDSYEYRYMQTNEEIGDDYTYVSFGPAALDGTIYRVNVGLRDPVPFKVFSQWVLNRLKKMAENTEHQKMKKVYEENVRVQGQPAVFAVYTQHIPGHTDIALHNRASVTYTHAIYYVDYGQYGVIFWIQTNSVMPLNTVNDKNRNKITQRQWQPMQTFVHSFRLHPNTVDSSR